MTLDEAIKYCEEVAVEQKSNAHKYEDLMLVEQNIKHITQAKYLEESMNDCEECAADHLQLAEWLKELKQLREQTRWTPISEGDKLPSDWVLVQIQENNRYLGEVPCVAKYQESEDDWIIVNDNVHYLKGYINKERYEEDMISVIAWTPLPKQYKIEGAMNEQKKMD